jgi:hypothetical protein
MDPGYVVVGKTGQPIDTANRTQPLSGGVATLYDSTAVVRSNRGARFKAVVINMESSHDSAADGLAISESDDNGTTWKTVYTRTYVQAVDGRLKVIYKLIGAPDFKVSFTNSANVLTTFRWSVLLDERERG